MEHPTDRRFNPAWGFVFFAVALTAFGFATGQIRVGRQPVVVDPETGIANNGTISVLI